MIDEIPAVVAAAFADGITEIRDAAELVVKESNRIGTLEQELTQLGFGVEGRADGLTIRGGRPAGRDPSQPRRSSHRHGRGRCCERDRRRVDRARVEAVASSYPNSTNTSRS